MTSTAGSPVSARGSGSIQSTFEDVVTRQTEVDVELGKDPAGRCARRPASQCALQRVVVLSSVTGPEPVRTQRSRPASWASASSSALSGNGMLTRLGDVDEIDVIRCPVRIEAKEQCRAALDDPLLGLHGEDPRQQPAVRASRRRWERLLWVPRPNPIREPLSRRLRRPPRPTHAECSSSWRCAVLGLRSDPCDAGRHPGSIRNPQSLADAPRRPRARCTKAPGLRAEGRRSCATA